MTNTNETLKDLRIIAFSYYLKDGENFFYDGLICYETQKQITIGFKIKTEKTELNVFNSTRQELISFVFKCLIIQGEFDYYIEKLYLNEYKDEFLIYCGDLKELYLTTKLFLKHQKRPLYREISFCRYHVHRKLNIFLTRFNKKAV